MPNQTLHSFTSINLHLGKMVNAVDAQEAYQMLLDNVSPFVLLLEPMVDLDGHWFYTSFSNVRICST